MIVRYADNKLSLFLTHVPPRVFLAAPSAGLPLTGLPAFLFYFFILSALFAAGVIY